MYPNEILCNITEYTVSKPANVFSHLKNVCVRRLFKTEFQTAAFEYLLAIHLALDIYKP